MTKPCATLVLAALSLLTAVEFACAAPPAPPAPPAGPDILDKAPKLSLATTADGLASYVAYFRRLGYKVTFDEELFDRRGKVQIFRFAARRPSRNGSHRVTAAINAAKNAVTASEHDETVYTYSSKSPK
jgi:hypothetical protein